LAGKVDCVCDNAIAGIAATATSTHRKHVAPSDAEDRNCIKPKCREWRRNK
jgi:hypothetical protein